VVVLVRVLLCICMIFAKFMICKSLKILKMIFKLKLFPFSLREKTKDRLLSLPNRFKE
jgi:hypothetical protein